MLHNCGCALRYGSTVTCLEVVSVLIPRVELPICGLNQGAEALGNVARYLQVHYLLDFEFGFPSSRIHNMLVTGEGNFLRARLER